MSMSIRKEYGRREGKNHLHELCAPLSNGQLCQAAVMGFDRVIFYPLDAVVTGVRAVRHCMLILHFSTARSLIVFMHALGRTGIGVTRTTRS